MLVCFWSMISPISARKKQAKLELLRWRAAANYVIDVYFRPVAAASRTRNINRYFEEQTGPTVRFAAERIDRQLKHRSSTLVACAQSSLHAHFT